VRLETSEDKKLTSSYTKI